MSGGRSKQFANLLPPLGIATRQSTDSFAVQDEDIRRRPKFIRDNALRGITVADVLNEVRCRAEFWNVDLNSYRADSARCIRLAAFTGA